MLLAELGMRGELSTLGKQTFASVVLSVYVGLVLSLDTLSELGEYCSLLSG